MEKFKRIKRLRVAIGALKAISLNTFRSLRRTRVKLFAKKTKPTGVGDAAVLGRICPPLKFVLACLFIFCTLIDLSVLNLHDVRAISSLDSQLYDALFLLGILVSNK